MNILDDIAEVFDDVEVVRIYSGANDGLHNASSREAMQRAAEDSGQLARQRPPEGVQDPGLK
jgi:hypothetical protein